MKNDKIEFTLVPSLTDLPLQSMEYQSALIKFSKQLPKELQVQTICFAFDSADGDGGFAGEFNFKLVSHLKAQVIKACAAFLEGVSGRSVKIKNGDKEIYVKHAKDLPAAVAAFESLKEKSLED